MKRKILVYTLLLFIVVGIFAQLLVPTYAANGLPNSLYFKQETNYTCTLASAVMMLRTRMYLDGNNDYPLITESSLRPTAWIENQGLRGSFTYAFNGNTFSVKNKSLSGISLSTLKSALSEHPEGIVLYCNSMPHAVLITHCEGDTVYCADPAPGYGENQIKLTSSQLGKYGNQSTILSKATRYWYISSYSITDSSIEFATIDLGTYYIRAKSGVYLKPTKVSTDSDDQQIGTASSKSDSMRFEVLSQGGGYSFKSYFNNQDTRINVWASTPSAGKHVTIYAHTGHYTQTWKLRSVGDGYAIVLANYGNLAITLENGKTILRNYTGADNQVFYFETERCQHDSWHLEAEYEEHIWVCDLCNNAFRWQGHYGGTATCEKPAVCVECNTVYGNSLGHDMSIVHYDNTQHWYECANCHGISDRYDHSGGTVTCQDRAICDVCRNPYGGTPDHRWTIITDSARHWYQCADCLSITDKQAHYGGTATCTEQAICKFCDIKYGSLKSHSYTVLKTDDTHHWYQCANCSATTGKTAHSGGTATCTKKAVCSTCKTEYGSLKSHSYSTTWNSDSKGHWHTCTSCEGKDSVANHTPSSAATENTAQTCTVCSYVLTPATGHIKHSYTVLQSDGTHHWYRCSGCNQTNQRAAHSGGTATCTNKAACATCNTAYGDLAAHHYTVLQKDGAYHWNQCASCNATDEMQLHSGGTATCQAQAICATCEAKYGELAEHQYGENSACITCGVSSGEASQPTEPSETTSLSTESTPSPTESVPDNTTSLSTPSEPVTAEPPQKSNTALWIAVIVVSIVCISLGATVVVLLLRKEKQ